MRKVICIVLLVFVAMSAKAQTQVLSGISSDSLLINMLFQESYFISGNHKRSVQDEFNATSLSFPYYFMVDHGLKHGGYYTPELLRYTVTCSANDSVPINDIVAVASKYRLIPATLRDMIFLIHDLQSVTKSHTLVSQNYVCLEDLQQYGIFTTEIPYSVFFGFIYTSTGVTGTMASYGFLKNGDSVLLKKP